MKTLMKFALCLTAACGLALSCAAQDIISTVVGGGPSNIPGTSANLYNPYQVAVDASNNVYVASQQLNRVFKITPAGVETVVAGNGFAGFGGDGKAAPLALLSNPYGVAVDGATPANVYIADRNNCVVRKVSGTTGIITTVAGLVTTPATGAPYTSCGYAGDGGKANAAQIYYPNMIAVNPTNSDLYIVDGGYGVVRKVAGGSATGAISTVAGSGGTSEGQTNCGSSAPYGDTGAAKDAYLCNPQGIALDTSVTPANIFITEAGRCDVREVVGSSSKIYQVAGSYTLGCGFTDNVNALSAQLNDPWQVHVTVSGTTSNVQVADYYNSRIRQFPIKYSAGVPASGTITTIGGKGQGGYCNDGGPVLNACIGPVGLAYDSAGNYYIGDYGSSRVRKVAKSNTYISTIDGWGPNATQTQPNYSDPVGVSATGGAISLYYPLGVFADPASTKVYVGGSNGEADYVWDSSTNTITGFAGNGSAGYAGDGGKASSVTTQLNLPIGLAKDSSGNIYIADNNNCAIRKVSTGGTISTYAGGSNNSLKGCGYTNSSAVDSQFSSPNSISIDASNNMYVSDYNNCAIRKISSGGQVSTIAGGPTVGCGSSGDGGPANKAQIYYPQENSVDAAGNVFFAEQGYGRVREIVAATGIIQTVAGTGQNGFTGDGIAIARELNQPYGLTVDANDNLFIADQNNQIVRWVTPTGYMITYGGLIPGGPISGYGFSGDGGSALNAQFEYPEQISRDSAGNTYIADQYNFRIREITAFAGYGLSGNSLSFGTQAVGGVSNFQSIAVSAIGPITIGNITAPAGFSEIDDCSGQALTAGQTCEIDVYFQPTAAGKSTGNLVIASNAYFSNNPNAVSLTGVGAGLTLTGSLAYGAVPINTASNSTLTLSSTGKATAISSISFTSAAFTVTGGTCPATGGTLAANASCTIIATFKPAALGNAKGTLVIKSNDPASPYLAQATGAGTEVKTSASSINFGAISYGTTATVNLTISNVGSASFTLSESITAGFVISSTGKTCGSSLAAGASCVLPVQYNPTAVGSNTGTLTLTTNGGSNPQIALSGSATSDVSVSPSSIAFGTITHATTKVVNVTVSNVGKIATLTVKTAVSGTGAADFSVLSTGNTCTAGAATGKSCVLPVQFKPAAAAAYAATLTITTNGGTNPTVALTGTGN